MAAKGELEAIGKAQLALIEQQESEAKAEAERIANLTEADHREAKALNIETIAKERLDAVLEMETAARAFASAYTRAEKTGAGLLTALRAEGVTSSGLMGTEPGRRIGSSLSVVLYRATGSNGLGDLKLKVGIAEAGASWTAGEASVVRRLNNEVCKDCTSPIKPALDAAYGGSQGCDCSRNYEPQTRSGVGPLPVRVTGISN